METAIDRQHAELDEIWARDGRIRLVGTLPESLPGRSWWMCLTLREPAQPQSTAPAWRMLRPVQRLRMSLLRVPGPYEVDAPGLRFDTVLPIGDLALPLPVLEADWDAHLVSASIKLRLGRRRGVPSKAALITFPWQHAGPFRVRPRYTDDDHLVLESRRVR
jgi:hypothetical protein